jgi:hypothetical protein
MAQSLRAAVVALNAAIEQCGLDDPPEVLAIRQAIKDMSRAVESYDVYGMQGKRLRAALEDEKQRISDLLNQVVGLPITQEEKVLAKHNKVKTLVPVAIPSPDLAQQKQRRRGTKPSEGVRSHEQLRKGKAAPPKAGKSKQKRKKPDGKPALGRHNRPVQRTKKAKK